MKFAKKFGDVINVSNSLRAYLHETMSKYEPGRSIGILHASETTKDEQFCPRSYALMELTNTKPKGMVVSTSLRHTFDQGRDIERRLQEEWARDIVIGDWKCWFCDHDLKFGFSPKKCDHCGAPSKYIKHVESRFTCSVSGMSCGVDMMVRLPGHQKATMVECKIMAPDMFKNLKAPLQEHRSRTNLYMQIARNSKDYRAKFINTDHALVLYVCRTFGFGDPTLDEEGIPDNTTPFKEFRVERKEEEAMAIINNAAPWLTWKKEGVIPDRICYGPTCPRAKKCPVAKHCFIGTYPPGDIVVGEDHDQEEDQG